MKRGTDGSVGKRWRQESTTVAPYTPLQASAKM